MLWGYIAPRYLADFVPFLVLASAVAMVDIWRRLDGRGRRARTGAVTVIALVALFSVAANLGMASTPNDQWNPTQVHNYVEAQQTVSNLTGHTLQSNVHRGDSLPSYAPADQLFIIGECDGLYISNGENYSTVPSQAFVHTTWMAVERGHRFQHTFRITFNQPGSTTPGLGLVSAGRNSVSVNVAATPSRRLVRVLFDFASPGHKVYQYTPYVVPGSTHTVQVITDPATHLVLVSMDGTAYLQGILITNQPIVVDSQHAVSPGDPPALSVTNITPLTPQPTLCQSLDH